MSESRIDAFVKMVAAHEKFVAALKASGLAFTIVWPTGFFSDGRARRQGRRARLRSRRNSSN